MGMRNIWKSLYYKEHLVLKNGTEVIMKSHKGQKLHADCGHVLLKTFTSAYVSAGRRSLKYKLDKNLHSSAKSQIPLK